MMITLDTPQTILCCTSPAWPSHPLGRPPPSPDLPLPLLLLPVALRVTTTVSLGTPAAAGVMCV